jgi:hypothetical protein
MRFLAFTPLVFASVGLFLFFGCRQAADHLPPDVPSGPALDPYKHPLWRAARDEAALAVEQGAPLAGEVEKLRHLLVALDYWPPLAGADRPGRTIDEKLAMALLLVIAAKGDKDVGARLRKEFQDAYSDCLPADIEGYLVGS